MYHLLRFLAPQRHGELRGELLVSWYFIAWYFRLRLQRNAGNHQTVLAVHGGMDGIFAVCNDTAATSRTQRVVVQRGGSGSRPERRWWYKRVIPPSSIFYLLRTNTSALLMAYRFGQARACWLPSSLPLYRQYYRHGRSGECRDRMSVQEHWVLPLLLQGHSPYSSSTL